MVEDLMAGFQPPDEDLDLDAGSTIEFFDELPSSGRGRWDSERVAVLKAFADELKTQPGRWAKYPFPAPSREAARSRASRITNGKVFTFGRSFRAVARGDETYVRYEGVQN